MIKNHGIINVSCLTTECIPNGDDAGIVSRYTIKPALEQSVKSKLHSFIWIPGI